MPLLRRVHGAGDLFPQYDFRDQIGKLGPVEHPYRIIQADPGTDGFEVFDRCRMRLEFRLTQGLDGPPGPFQLGVVARLRFQPGRKIRPLPAGQTGPLGIDRVLGPLAHEPGQSEVSAGEPLGGQLLVEQDHLSGPLAHEPERNRGTGKPTADDDDISRPHRAPPGNETIFD